MDTSEFHIRITNRMLGEILELEEKRLFIVNNIKLCHEIFNENAAVAGELSFSIDGIRSGKEQFVKNYKKILLETGLYQINRSADLLIMHENLFENIPHITGRGQFRVIPMTYLMPQGEFNTVSPEKIPVELDTLFSWLSTQKDLHPALLSGIVMREIYRICPFNSGSETIARIIAIKILSEKGFPVFIALEDELSKHRSLKEEIYMPEAFDPMTKWIKTYLGILNKSLQVICESIKKLFSEKPLNIRQHAILQFMINNERITNKSYCRIFGIGRTQAYKDLHELESRRLIIPVGSGRSRAYILNTSI